MYIMWQNTLYENISDRYNQSKYNGNSSRFVDCDYDCKKCGRRDGYEKYLLLLERRVSNVENLIILQWVVMQYKIKSNIKKSTTAETREVTCINVNVNVNINVML